MHTQKIKWRSTNSTQKNFKSGILSNNVALPWLKRHKNSEQKMLINVGKTQI